MNRLVVKGLVEATVVLLIQAVTLFVSSGQIDWVMAWAYVLLKVGNVAISTCMILPRNPDLIAERAEAKENTKSWDRTLIKIGIILHFATLLIAGLDIRFGWSPPFAFSTQLVALVFGVASYGLASWAVMSNKFFSTTVRIQKDRGHIVITDGPYQYVRHPGYVGMVVGWVATPLMLASLWALIPAVFIACGLVVRTSLEDKTLQEELDGYRDYAQRVKYRLIPKIW